LIVVAEVGKTHLVQLNVRASSGAEFADDGLIGLAEIEVEFIHIRISTFAHGLPPAAIMQNAGGPNSHLGILTRDVSLEKPEVLDHGVRASLDFSRYL